jgi:periplasmic copper chaperone A
MRIRVLAAVTGTLTVGWLVLAGPASAHVTVSAPGATKGGNDIAITFRVPTESATLSTVGVAVQFPTGTPIASVSVQAQPGWTFTEKSVKLSTPIKTDDGDITDAVSEIDWKVAPGGSGIKPGEFGEFVVIAGQLPQAAEITFKAVQTYSDGSQVPWIDVPAPGSTAEPEHPAPTLQLTAADAPSSVSPAAPSNTRPVVLSTIALVLAAAAAVLGGLALRRSRGRPS